METIYTSYSCTSDIPEPNNDIVSLRNCSLKPSNDPNASLIKLFSLSFGILDSPLGFGFMHAQTRQWLTNLGKEHIIQQNRSQCCSFVGFI